MAAARTFTMDTTTPAEESAEPCLDNSSKNDSSNDSKKRILDKYLTRYAFTRRGRVILLTLAILCAVLAIVVVALAGAWPRWPRYVGRTCDKPACLVASAQILESSDLSAPVCSDPWSWACGGWQELHSSLPNWSYKEDLDYRETVRARALIGALPPGLPGSPEWLLTELYSSCAATDAIEIEGDRPLKKIIRDLDGWYVLRSWYPLRWNFRSSLARIHSRYGVHPYFGVRVVDRREHRSGQLADAHRRHQPVVTSTMTSDDYDAEGVIVLTPPELGLPHPALYFKPAEHPITVSYKRLLRDVTTLLGATSDSAARFSDDVYYYERRLAEAQNVAQQPATSSREDNQDYHSTREHDYEAVTLQQLQTLAPQLPVWEVLAAMFPRSKLKLDSTMVLVPSIKYVQRLSELISTTDRSPINNYMMWTLTLSYLPFLSSPYRSALDEFERSLAGVQQAPPLPRWRRCTQLVRQWAGAAILQDNSRDERRGQIASVTREKETKDRVVKIFNVIRDGVVAAVLRSPYVNGERQREAARKLRRTTVQIGFPTEAKSSSYSSRLYREMSVQHGALFENALAAKEAERARFENLLSSTILDSGRGKNEGVQHTTVTLLDSLTRPPLSIRYVTSQNVVTIPAAILSPPHFHVDHPISLQMARIGVPIAEVLFSAIFDIVADNDTETFLKCFSHYITTENGRYGPALRNSAVHLSAVRVAIRSLDTMAYELISSVFGKPQTTSPSTNEAYYYDKRFKTMKEYQHGLGDMTPKALFTLTYAQTMCSKVTPEMEQLSPLVDGKLSDHDLFTLAWSRVSELRKSVGCSRSNSDICPSSL